MNDTQKSVIESNLELALGQMMASIRLRGEGNTEQAELRHDNAVLYLKRAALARIEVLAGDPPLA